MLKTKKQYQNELKKIIKALKPYRPEKIILFGSAAKGNWQEESDIDLLIIKDSFLNRITRAAEVEKLLSDRKLPIDVLVYTPSEIEQNLRVKGSFTEEILKTGKVIYAI